MKKNIIGNLKSIMKIEKATKKCKRKSEWHEVTALMVWEANEIEAKYQGDERRAAIANMRLRQLMKKRVARLKGESFQH